MHDSSFLKVAHCTQWRAEDWKNMVTAPGNGYPKQGGHPKSEIAEIKML